MLDLADLFLYLFYAGGQLLGGGLGGVVLGVLVRGVGQLLGDLGLLVVRARLRGFLAGLVPVEVRAGGGVC